MGRKAKIEDRKWKSGKERSRFLALRTRDGAEFFAALGMTITKVWQGVREWSGDAAYETYAACAVRNRAGRVLSREEFYVEQLQRKYSRVSRCC
jgi:uncharacterized short protein YbdD (DUF466 family)